MDIPTVEKAHAILEQANGLESAPWIRHSFMVGIAARILSSHLPDLDPDAAYIIGCLHDIGRRDREAGMRHVLVGYHYLLELGYPDAAQICVTHAFPVKDVRSIYCEWDCPQEDVEFIQEY